MKRLVLLSAGLVLGLVVAELALRILGVSVSPQAVFFVPDPVAGWAHRPGAVGVWTYEGHALVSINRQGQRDSERRVRKESGVVRIAVLGDSFASAFQVAQSGDFCSVIERTLGSCPALRGRKLEVINFGVNAYGTAQELLTLRNRVWQYSPDVVVLAFYPNDLYDNSEDLQREYPEYAQWGRPYFRLANGSLVLDDSFAHEPEFLAALRDARDPGTAFGKGIHRLLWRLRVWQLVSRARSSGKANLEERFAAALLSSPRDQHWDDAWKLTEALLTTTNAECGSHGAGFLLVIVSYAYQVYPGRAARERMLDKLGVPDALYVNHRLEALGRREKFKVLSLAEPMQSLADKQHVYFHGFANTAMGRGHWNERGHRVAGELISAAVCEMFEAKVTTRTSSALHSKDGGRQPSVGSRSR
jgi:hypothetical protein